METPDLISAFIGANLYLFGRLMVTYKGDKKFFLYLRMAGLVILVISLVKIAFGVLS